MNDSSMRRAPLRAALLLDAVASGAMGLLFLAAAALLAPLLGLPDTLLRVSGAVLVPFAALLVWLAARAAPPRAFVGAVVAGNAAWVVASVTLLASGAVQPTMLGEAVVLAQAAAVALFAWLEWRALRRLGGALVPTA